MFTAKDNTNIKIPYNINITTNYKILEHLLKTPTLAHYDALPLSII